MSGNTLYSFHALVSSSCLRDKLIIAVSLNLFVIVLGVWFKKPIERKFILEPSGRSSFHEGLKFGLVSGAV